MWYICNKSMTAGELTKKLYEIIGELSLLNEDEILSAELNVVDTESCISDIASDRECRVDDEYNNLVKKLREIPPHLLHDYFTYAKQYAETDGYWDNYSEGKSEYWYDILEPRIFPKEEKEEIPERIVAQEEEIVDLDQFVDY